MGEAAPRLLAGAAAPRVRGWPLTTPPGGIAPGPKLSKRLPEHRVYPYLLRNLTAQRLNHIWGCDIWDIRLRHGWLYLVAIIDWFSRYVVSWELDEMLELGFVLAAIVGRSACRPGNGLADHQRALVWREQPQQPRPAI